MNATISDNIDRVIRAIREAGGEISKESERECINTLRRVIGPKVQEKAAEKTPKLFRTLQASGQTQDITDGVKITFGGQASEYAARQHEDESFGHSGPRKGKYVYMGTAALIGGKRGGGKYSLLNNAGARLGDWNEPRNNTGITSMFGRSDLAFERRKSKGGGRRWRFTNVQYLKRYPASRFNPKVGQAHFLHGAPNSALDETRDFRHGQLRKAALVGAKKALRRINPPMAAGGGGGA